MGKKQKKQSTNVTAETFKIHKNKSLTANLNQFIRVLKVKHNDLSTKQYLNHIHKFIYNFSKKKGALPQSLVVETTSKVKICKQCDKWAMGTKKMVQCEACEDHYHLECAKKYKAKQDWRCESCSTIRVSQVSSVSSNQQKECSKCGKNKNQLNIKCLKCQKSFHQSCYTGEACVCGDCSKEIKSKIKQHQLTLVESFKRASQNSKRKSQQPKKEPNFLKKSIKQVERLEDEHKTDETKLEKEINQSTNASTIFASCKRFRAGFPEMTTEQIGKYKENLLFAILSKNMEYTEKLQCHDCSLYDDNEDSVDFAILHLSMSDMKMFQAYKKQPIGPFRLQYKEQCGYDVVADKDLPKGMIVCEYVGDVYTFRNALRLEKNDSIMQLKKGKNADESLLIVPRKYTNIARFINGINQQDPQKAQKQNVDTVRALAQGRPVVILYTCKSVKKGQSLLYNYGAGIAKVRYDTSEYQ